MSHIAVIFALLPFYCLGALPCGYLIARRAGCDITAVGSGNVGATNVARTLGKKAGLLTLLLDTGKGFLAPAIGYLVSGTTAFAALAGVVTVFGHCISIPPYLKGGKGVATALGVILFLNPLIALSSVGVFLIILWSSRLVSLSSMGAALFMPIIAIFLQEENQIILTLVAISAIVLLRHKKNVQRILEGQEERFHFARREKGSELSP